MVVLELEAVYAQAAPHTKLLNKRFVGAHHWLGPLKEALVARLAADKVQTSSAALLDLVALTIFRRARGKNALCTHEKCIARGGHTPAAVAFRFSRVNIRDYSRGCFLDVSNVGISRRLKLYM